MAAPVAGANTTEDPAVQKKRFNDFFRKAFKSVPKIG
ncbi:hypothetical protein TSAR_008352 [Trichomalopsis sarcophagae]|uniref:Uncharacterized protein n=1 Tax=Trichomalopsis sarcophagae TaxID=543379 RepID=A0A232EZA6_9HYME|nr:hypothetical protein TSAR_008352 [Trichomalopsis sarcophagae]